MEIGISLDDVDRAAGRLLGVAHRTPVLTSQTLNERVGASVFIKAENYQRMGAFKFRGAYNAISSLDDDVRARGIATWSSGNHGQAIALASRLHGVPAAIVMPFDTPQTKLDATAGYGAEIVHYDRYTGDRDAVGAKLADERGMTIIHPYDNWTVMAGQGTVAQELLEDTGPLDAIVAPIGGGGLISGCSTVAKAHPDPPRVIGVEPEAGDDTKRSLAAGEIVTIPVPRTIADGQQVSYPGALTFPVMQERVDEVALVTDAEIVQTMRFVFERMKVVIEPSGASALAAVLHGKIDVAGQRVGVVISGGNIGVERFAELMVP